MAASTSTDSTMGDENKVGLLSPADCSSEECFLKLEKIKDIRKKTVQFEKLKLILKELLGEAEEEKHTLGKFKNEINLLLQEKMAHVEELRLIHTDINTMENLIKNSTVDHNNTVNEIKKHLEKYKPLKSELDAMLQGIGLPVSKGVDLEEFDVATNETSSEQEPNTHSPEKSGVGDMFVMNETKNKLHLGAGDNTASSSHPPPMKLCGTCHQYIHRNAPICPLCKAKSRSRNPKKQKKTSKIEVD